MELGLRAVLDIDRFGECTVKRPASAQSFAQSLFGDVKFASPLCEGLRFAIPFDAMIIPSIVRLFNLGGPAHVAVRVLRAWSCVRAIVVRAFNPVPWRWSRANKGKEGREIPTTVAEKVNAAPAVMLESGAIGILASVDDVTPYDVFRRIRLVRRMPMFRHAGASPSTFHAATRCRVAAE
jgi:hypothetical protein